MSTEFRKSLRQKLDLFLAKVPKRGLELQSGTPMLPKETTTDAKYEAGKKVSVTDPDFFAYTRTEHKTLIGNWQGGGIRTTCNEFVGVTGNTMGAKINLGQFEIASVLQSMGKGHAFVPWNSGAPPEYGDVFRSEALHMGISLDFTGNLWNTVESGQGGSGKGVDILMRKQKLWNPAGLKGWVDMELFLDPRPAVPEWLIGWWVVYHGDKTYHYHFDQYHQVTHAPFKAEGGAKPDDIALDTAVFVNERSENVSFRWRDGSTETFAHSPDSFPGLMEKMDGKAVNADGSVDAMHGVRL